MLLWSPDRGDTPPTRWVRWVRLISTPALRSPGTGETPTLSTLDFYMARLHGAIERDPAQHEKLIVRIKEILAQVARCVPRLFCSSLCSPDGAALHAGLPQAGPALVGLGGNACILLSSGVPGVCGL